MTEAERRTIENLLARIDSICEGCEPSRGCSLCELLLAAEPVRALVKEDEA